MILYEVQTRKGGTFAFLDVNHSTALQTAAWRYGMKNIVSISWETHDRFGWLLQRHA